MWLKNYDLSFCNSEKSIYDKLSDKIIKLIIMDIALTGSKDGLSLFKELKSSEKIFKIPIICATSYDTYELKAIAIKAGADVYLTKPVLRNNLINMIVKFQF